MPILEKLGSFYLGREYDLAGRRRLETPVMYDARDLVTHAVCVGMTGSGKTGLCIDLLEEAAIDHVPAIIIDPKGDITNLLLKFPELRAEDFEPWANIDDARRKGMTVQEYSKTIAETWAKGLAEWDQGPDRLRLAQTSAEVRVLTPGSDAGIPVSILASLAAPPLSWDDEAELLREQIQGTVSALLGLVDVQAEPLQSREHILLSTVVEHYWRQGQDLDLATLITAVQSPPVRQLGVFDVDTFFPEKERFGLALRLNSIIAAPGFASWLSGEPLDVARMFHSEAGHPRHSIFYLAHLSETERMFFVTLLLEQVVAWVRQQSGTTSLRALLYFDEVFGYFPPVSMPPSKRPLLTLLKQARASGLGVLLCTQNPVDIDYKGLSNAGTWFIGKLQTDRDKARMLDGLESVSAEGGNAPDRAELERIIAGLDSRIFLLHNVHADAPLTFETRWALSYLRGPLTRSQVRTLVGPRLPAAPAAAAQGIQPPVSPPSLHPSPAAAQAAPPVLPADVPVVFMPMKVTAATARSQAPTGLGAPPGEPRLAYQPALLVMGRVSYQDLRRGVSLTSRTGLLLPPGYLSPVVRWDESEAVEMDPAELATAPEPGATFGEVPRELATASSLRAYQRAAGDYLYRHSRLEIWHCRELDLYGLPGESEGAFRVRAQQVARERRDEKVESLRDQLEEQRLELEQRLDRERRELEADRMRHEARQREELLSAGETVIGMLGLFGRRRRTAGFSRAATKRRLTATAGAEVRESEIAIERLRRAIDDLRETFEGQSAEIGNRWEQACVRFDTYAVTPRRTDVVIDLAAVAWVPYWEFEEAADFRRGVSAWR